MKKYLLIVALAMTGCATSTEDESIWSFKFQPEQNFDWMPNELTWQNNVRNCRSQPQCNAADLFSKF
jgi:hypothetical protein